MKEQKTKNQKASKSQQTRTKTKRTHPRLFNPHIQHKTERAGHTSAQKAERFAVPGASVVGEEPIFKFGLAHSSLGLGFTCEVELKMSWRERERIAERKLAGAYGEQQQHHRHHTPAQIEQAQMHGRLYQTEEPGCVPQVVTATPITDSGARNSRLSGITQATGLSPDYVSNPWAEEDRQRMSGRMSGSKGYHDHHAQDGYHGGDDQARRTSGPMTHLHGPHGTSGKNPRTMDKEQYMDLIREGYSSGLARALSENASRYDFRFWVVDNSGSMQIGDGHRIVTKGGKSKAVACTRWEEIKETVKYHAQMASVLDCPTIFQLLNDPGLRTTPQRFSVCEHGLAFAQNEVAKAIETMRKVSPSGVTPLTQHIWDIEEQISRMAEDLRRSGKIVAIILATDGLPTDEQGYGGEDITDEFIRALRSLEGLPVWTVIRLCTDEQAVKDFYNALDTQLEISVEVLDDYMGEAREVYKQNPWITYALPLHRCRELGYHDRLFDLIDERPLTAGEARAFCCFILGLSEDELPDPGADPSGFLKAVKVQQEKESLQWNPMKKKMTPWILTKDLKKSFSNRNCVIM